MMRSRVRCLFVLAALGVSACVAQAPRPDDDGGDRTASSERQVGAWYSTWYTNVGRYVWSVGNGVGSGQQLVGDVDGDGRDDAVLFFPQDGSWYVGRSTGEALADFVRSPVTFGGDATRRWLADVDGDGRDDAVTYRADLGRWDVALGQAAGTFTSPTTWIEGHGVGSDHPLVGDVDGDGRADAVVLFEGWDGGRWYVSRSTGTEFGAYEHWRSDFSVGTPMLGDLDGDGRDDAVVMSDGRWRVSYSTGTSFEGEAVVADGHGAGGAQAMLADADADGLDDLIAYVPQLHGGAMFAAFSQGRNEPASVPLAAHPWKLGVGSLYYTAHRPGAPTDFSWVSLGDVTGDGRADAVSYMNHDGSWRVVPAEHGSGLMVNSWEYWDIGFRPQLGGSRGYDSRDPALVDAHLQMLADAQIDFLILDLTNAVQAEPMLGGARTVCERIAAWNADPGHRPLRYSIAIGHLQRTGQPITVEQEAAFVQQQFVDDPVCGGDNYYRHEGRPMLSLYSSWSQRQTWEQWGGDKSASSAFWMRFAHGEISPGGPVPASQFHEYVGWGMPSGALPNPELMVVMPGWNNHLGWFVSRTLDGDEAGFYVDRGWERVLDAMPRMVIINSFNEFAEETGIEPSDTSLQHGAEESWPSPGLYWELTRDYIAMYRAG